MNGIYWIVSTLCGIGFGEFETRKEVEACAREHGYKYVVRINKNKCPGTQGAGIRYRVK